MRIASGALDMRRSFGTPLDMQRCPRHLCAICLAGTPRLTKPRKRASASHPCGRERDRRDYAAHRAARSETVVFLPPFSRRRRISNCPQGQYIETDASTDASVISNGARRAPYLEPRNARHNPQSTQTRLTRAVNPASISFGIDPACSESAIRSACSFPKRTA